MAKNKLNTLYTSDSIQQEKSILVWNLVVLIIRFIYGKAFVCERNKETVNVSEDLIQELISR